MFSNQKNNFFKSKWFYGIIALALLAFGIWVNYDGKSQKTNTPAKVEQESQAQTQASKQGMVDSLRQETPEKINEKPTDESGQPLQPSEEKQQSYYLVREVEGVVKVFYCDENGQESLHQITSIPFSLLSGEDQKMLTEGVHIDTESELASFLENFDS